jgi:hypothetical protein
MAEFEPVTEAQFEATALPQRPAALTAVAAEFDPERRSLVIRLNNGVTTTIPLALIPELAEAAPADLATLTVEGRGYGLHVPSLDVDLSIPRMLETALGAVGMAQAERRAEASRRNGQLGGRPRKTKAP